MNVKNNFYYCNHYMTSRHDLTSRSRLDSYKRLVSKFERLVSAGDTNVLVSGS